MEERENHIGFWAVCMLVLAALFIVTGIIARLIDTTVSPWAITECMALEIVLIMGTGMILISRKNRLAKKAAAK